MSELLITDSLTACLHCFSSSIVYDEILACIQTCSLEMNACVTTQAAYSVIPGASILLCSCHCRDMWLHQLLERSSSVSRFMISLNLG